jgi:hypothetical protein
MPLVSRQDQYTYRFTQEQAGWTILDDIRAPSGSVIFDVLRPDGSVVGSAQSFSGSNPGRFWMYLPAGNYRAARAGQRRQRQRRSSLHRSHGCRTITSWAAPATPAMRCRCRPARTR